MIPPILLMILFTWSLTAGAAIPLFQNTNTVPTIQGVDGRLVAITSINPAANEAVVHVDTVDKFGNRLRLVKTAKFSPSKLKNFATICIRNPVACAAAGLISSALIYHGWTIYSDGTIIIPSTSISYPTCVSKSIPADGAPGGITTALGPIACANGPNWAGRYFVNSLSVLSGGTQNSYYEKWFYIDGDTTARYGAVYQYQFNTEPLQQSDNQEISDNQLAEIIITDPANLQIEAGVFPDVFEPVNITESATQTDVNLAAPISPGATNDFDQSLRDHEDRLNNWNSDLDQMPLIPDNFYSSQYPNGLVGIWDQKKEALLNTSFMQSLDEFIPTASVSNSCPSFNFDLNVGIANFGTQTISVPCYVWDFIGLIILITAAFTARSIIFGG